MQDCFDAKQAKYAVLSRLIESGLLTDEQAYDDEIIAALPKEIL